MNGQAAAYESRSAAIVAGDVVGYSRLMGADARATLELLSSCRQRIRDCVGEHHGRVIDLTGDSALIEFPDAVTAITCVLSVQQSLAERNQGLPEDRCMWFRFGVVLGEVMVDEGVIYGDVVNVAARLQALADPGGLCIAANVQVAIKDKLKLGFEYLGERHLKNIDQPVEAYRVHEDEQVALRKASVRKGGQSLVSTSQQSIAVLPFANRSSEPEHEHFADGIAEDIITDLSRFRELFVISSNSSFVYKGIASSAQQVGRELGVRNVLQGSLRIAGQRLRINVELVDASNGASIWSERYDREIEDIFDVQDELTQTIVSCMAVRLERAEQIHALRSSPSDLQAYGLLLKGLHLIQGYTRDANRQARWLYKQALDIDPAYARAYACLSRTYVYDWRYSWTDDPELALQRALTLANTAVGLDAGDARGHAELGFASLYSKQNELALMSYERALHLNPNDADIKVDMADALAYSGRSQDGVKLIKEAMCLNPFYPDTYLWYLADAYYELREYQRVIDAVEQMNNPAEGQRLLAAACGQLGLTEKARLAAAAVLERQPDFSAAQWVLRQPEVNPKEWEHFAEGLHKAGLP